MSIAQLTGQLSRPAAPPLIIERLLRHREEVWEQVRQEADIDHLLGRLVLTSIVSLAGYGLVLGVSHPAWFLQGPASAIKLPLLHLLTLAICLPSLYLFNLLYGGSLSLRQVVALTLAAITVMAGLALAFAPISVFFLLTAHDYHFFKLLNVVILAFTGLTGLTVLVDGMRYMNRPARSVSLASPRVDQVDEAPEPTTHRSRQATMPLLMLWLGLFGFVGTQLAWTLSPFFGMPDQPFQLFQTAEGNFYADMAATALRLVRPGR